MPAGHSPYVLTLVQRSSHGTNTSCDGVQKVDTLRPVFPEGRLPSYRLSFLQHTMWDG